MEKNALQRLYEDSVDAKDYTPLYSVDEQLEEDNDFMFNMSDDSREALFSRVEKVELNENPQSSEQEEPLEQVEDEDEEEEELVTEEPKRGRGRPRKNPEMELEMEIKPQKVTTNNSSLNNFMDSLAHDLIQELRLSNYKTRNFSREQMSVILNYLEEKI